MSTNNSNLSAFKHPFYKTIEKSTTEKADSNKRTKTKTIFKLFLGKVDVYFNYAVLI